MLTVTAAKINGTKGQQQSSKLYMLACFRDLNGAYVQFSRPAHNQRRAGDGGPE
jgi:hypothetical protein